LVLINKCDSPIAEPAVAINQFFGFKKMTKRYRNFEFKFISALTGMNCNFVAKWIAIQAKKYDSPKKARKSVPCC